MKSNFTYSTCWKKSLILRYPVNDILSVNNICFVKKNNDYYFQHFFELPQNLNFVDIINKKTIEDAKFVFKYINKSNLVNLEKWCNLYNYEIEIIDEWKAPFLKVDKQIEDIFENSPHKQTKKNYRHYKKNKDKYEFTTSIKHNTLDLWNCVLKIDNDSWKKEENSDMKSLEREDLQYLPFMLNNPDKVSLVVMFEDKKPISYSLFFQENNLWYAVKWGSNNSGRNNYAGIICLFEHLNIIYNKNNNFIIDFWGRNNNVYDKLKNFDIERMHFSIKRRR